MKFWQTFRRRLLSIALPMTKFLGKLHAPYSHKMITGYDYYAAIEALKKGHVLITRTRGEFSNNFIPGFFTHAAIYYGGPSELIIEAVGEGVRYIPLAQFMLHKDFVAILEPTFIDEAKMSIASEVAWSLKGTPYDYFFEPGHKAFYCSELVQFCYDAVALQSSMPFTKRETMGIVTVTPHDYWCAREKFKPIWANIPYEIHLK